MYALLCFSATGKVISAWAGWAVAGWQIWSSRARQQGLLLPWAWTLVFFLHQLIVQGAAAKTCRQHLFQNVQHFTAD